MYKNDNILNLYILFYYLLNTYSYIKYFFNFVNICTNIFWGANFATLSFLFII